MVCLLDMPFFYYQFVRFVAMAGFAYLAFVENEENKKNEVIVYIGLAILFQPFIKIALGRYLWNIVDVIVGVGLLLSLALPKKVKKRIREKNSNENVMVNAFGNQTETKSEMSIKNKWLNPTDDFGKLGKGIEFELKTYVHDKKENDNNDFTII